MASPTEYARRRRITARVELWKPTIAAIVAVHTGKTLDELGIILFNWCGDETDPHQIAWNIINDAQRRKTREIMEVKLYFTAAKVCLGGCANDWWLADYSGNYHSSAQYWLPHGYNPIGKTAAQITAEGGRFMA